MKILEDGLDFPFEIHLKTIYRDFIDGDVYKHKVVECKQEIVMP